MEIVKGDGCTSFFLDVNDKRFTERTVGNQYAILLAVTEYVSRKCDIADYQRLVETLLEFIEPDSYSSDEPCDQCGDTYTETTWEI